MSNEPSTENPAKREMIRELLASAAEKATAEQRFEDARSLWDAADKHFFPTPSISPLAVFHYESRETLQRGLEEFAKPIAFLERYQTDHERELLATNVEFTNSDLWVALTNRICDAKRIVTNAQIHSLINGYRRLGKLFFDKGDYAEAVLHLGHAMRLDGNIDFNPYSYLNFRHVDLLLSAYELHAAADPKNGGYHPSYDLALLEGKLTVCLKTQTGSKRLIQYTSDKLMGTTYRLARLLKLKGDYPQAAACIRATFTRLLNPELTFHYDSYSSMLRQDEWYVLAKYLPHLNYLLGTIELARGKSAKATTALKTARRLVNEYIEKLHAIPLFEQLGFDNYQKDKSNPACNGAYRDMYETLDSLQQLSIQVDQLLTVKKQSTQSE